ncbi:MAG: hypothetical protein L0G41_02615 [Psychrobacter sp.]|nr:hypothetical protein [Psychrobacter sp.]
MPKLSKEQIKRIADTASMFDGVRLMCDGYKISLYDRLHGRQMRTELYVNGRIQGKWFIEKNQCPETKFYREFQKYIKVGPKANQRERVDVGVRQGDFASVGQALRHLNKVCDSVEVIEGEGL